MEEFGGEAQLQVLATAVAMGLSVHAGPFDQCAQPFVEGMHFGVFAAGTVDQRCETERGV